MKGFRIAGGSVPGTDHTKPGQPGWTNSQDAYTWRQDEDLLVAVICDGCGSTPHAEVGAKIGAQLVARYLFEALHDNLSPIPDMLQDVRSAVVAELVRLADAMTGYFSSSVEQIVLDHFLFTIMGVAMNPEETAVFSLGDGVYAVNGEVHIVEPHQGNAPPYIGNLTRKRQNDRPVSEFILHKVLPTNAVGSILIGSDGVGDIIKAEHLGLPGKTEVLGPLEQFWTQDRFVTNPDMIRRRLAVANREWAEDGQIHHGLLHDDTTLVVIRRESPLIAEK